MIELEKTYLAKYLPGDLVDFSSREMIDIYIPASFEHPKIRIRKNGDKYEITKKEPIAGDSSEMLEQTIKITADEFKEFKNLPGKRVSKTRYLYNFNGQIAEIDIFQEDLKGLVLIDFEFDTKDEKDAFMMPDFCLAEVTHEKFTAGGMICGKKYEDIAQKLAGYKYMKIGL